MRKQKYMTLKQYIKLVKLRREQILFDNFIAELNKQNPKFLDLIKFYHAEK